MSTTTKRVAISFLIIFVCCGFPVLTFLYPIFRLHRSAYQFFDEVKGQVDPEELRVWAARFAASNPNWARIGDETLPLSLRNLNSQHHFNPSIGGGSTNSGTPAPYVIMLYGGGFFHWGFDIGPTNFTESSSDEFEVIRWVPGIYFRREG